MQDGYTNEIAGVGCSQIVEQNPRIPAASAWRASSPLPIPASSVSKAVPNRTKKIFSKDISSYHRLPPPVLARCRAYVETKRRSASKSTPPSRRARGPLLVITPPKSNCKQPRYVVTCRQLVTVLVVYKNCLCCSCKSTRLLTYFSL